MYVFSVSTKTHYLLLLSRRGLERGAMLASWWLGSFLVSPSPEGERGLGYFAQPVLLRPSLPAPDALLAPDMRNPASPSQELGKKRDLEIVK